MVVLEGKREEAFLLIITQITMTKILEVLALTLLLPAKDGAGFSVIARSSLPSGRSCELSRYWQLSASSSSSTTRRPDASAAIQAALEASRAYGPTSPEARVAWDAVEEMDASDNRFVTAARSARR
jgi:hypothetical protein